MSAAATVARSRILPHGPLDLLRQQAVTGSSIFGGLAGEGDVEQGPVFADRRQLVDPPGAGRLVVVGGQRVEEAPGAAAVRGARTQVGHEVRQPVEVEHDHAGAREGAGLGFAAGAGVEGAVVVTGITWVVSLSGGGFWWVAP